MPILPVPGGNGATPSQSYYQGTNHGEYQFISLSDVINNFQAAYVGEGKILQNVLNGDVSFHAHRALQELHYDTIKSCKSIEVEVCPNLKIPLPNDYVNYVGLAYVDANGIENKIYPTSKTSNPFAVEQLDCDDCGDSSGSYQFNSDGTLKSQTIGDCVTGCDFNTSWQNTNFTGTGSLGLASVDAAVVTMLGDGTFPSNQDAIDYYTSWINAVDTHCNCLATNSAVINCGSFTGWANYNQVGIQGGMSGAGWSNLTAGAMGVVWLLGGQWGTNPTDGVEIEDFTTPDQTSNSWDSYKSNGGNVGDAQTTSLGKRYGLEAQYAQSNGSYYIDCHSGNIHFSSALSGKTIVLKYISDGIGTEDEAIVPKLAEEAMYKWIAYGCASARIDVPAGIIQRLKQEKFAETRKAKIRLSNIKIEEISQIMRGKSKFIQH